MRSGKATPRDAPPPVPPRHRRGGNNDAERHAPARRLRAAGDGPEPRLRLRTDVIRYWRESRKFGVVDPLTGTTSECDLTGDATKMIAARFEQETGRPKPRGYVACRGALSEAFMDGALATHLPWSGLQAA